MLLVIAITTFAAIALGVIALARRPADPVRARARALGGSDGAARDADLPFNRRITVPALRRLLNGLYALLPPRWLRALERLLVIAGEPMRVDSFLLLWVLFAVTAAAVGMLVYDVRGLVFFGVAGVVIPFVWLRRKARARQRQISNALPDAIDLLVTCVEAGLGLDNALIRVGEATEGPLGDEIDLTLREIAMGRGREEALLELGSRSGLPDFDGFIRPIMQAERGGVSIGQALRIQSETLRTRRRLRAQTHAQKLPVKMTIPIGLFFIPAVLVVGIGSAVLSFVEFFKTV